MITLLHLNWRGGSPHLILYTVKGEIAMEFPISKERAATLKAKGCQIGQD